MKIDKPLKKHPGLASLISRLLTTPQHDLPDLLATVPHWKWPRSDLHSWAKVLNRFDSILQDFIKDYNVDKLQLNAFTPHTKRTILEILRFETMLLENSTNRKLFASYDRLNSLLFTSDLQVLVAVLQLVLRPSQQYSSQQPSAHSHNISTARLLSLSRRWAGLSERGLEFADLFPMTQSESGKDKDRRHQADWPLELSEVSYQFYRKETSAKETEKGKELEATPTKPSTSGALPSLPPSASAGTTTAPGLTTIHTGPLTGEKTPVEVLSDLIEEYSLPDEEKFELFCRVRVAWALAKGRQEEREYLVRARLLAIAIYAHTQDESHAQSDFFLYEPELIPHIAQLIHPDRSVPIQVQTSAVVALDGLGRYRTKISEVLTAVNSGVSHGILMGQVRRAVAELARPESLMPGEFADALLAFIVYLTSNPAGGTMIVGAGLVPLLVQLLNNHLPSRLHIVSRTTTLIDTVLYGFGNAFQLFCNARGVDALVDRIQFEVDLDLKDYKAGETSENVPGNSYGRLAYNRASVLKHVLRTTHRMMQSSGTSEGLRTLVDSSLVSSVKKIVENRGLFGPAIFSIAINIMATFIHNEPTSLTVIQEAELPETFYKAVDLGIEPAIEVITAIPNAIGALCLNQSGQDQLAAHPNIIPRLFSIFTSEKHLKVLREKEHASFIGAAMDELIRHHPALKPMVFDAIQATFQKIEDLGQAFVPAKGEEHLYMLRLTSKDGQKAASPEKMDTAADGDELMLPVEESRATSQLSIHSAVADDAGDVDAEEEGEGESTKPDTSENVIMSFIDIIGRFLDGLFQHTPHCRDFVTKHSGVERISKLYTLPCLPYDFARSNAATSLIGVMRSMAESVPTQTLTRLSGQVRISLAETEAVWEKMEVDSKFERYIEITDQVELATANKLLRQLITLHIRINLLAEIYANAGYSQGRSANTILQVISGRDGLDIITDLGHVHRALVWETILLKAVLTAKGVNVPGSSSPGGLLRADESQEEVSGEGAPSSTAKVDDKKEPEQAEKAGRDQNAKALKYLASRLSTAPTPFFQAVVKLFLYTRRNPDPSQKKQATAVAMLVSKVLLEHLRWRGSEDKQASYAYSTMMIGLGTVLMFDERTAQNNLHTMLLTTFRQVGGLEALLDICRRCTAAIDQILNSPSRNKDEENELVYAFSGLKVALGLLHPLVASKTLFDSVQTSMLITRDKPKDSPDYFEPHDFLVKLRASILPFIAEVWNTSWLPSAPLSVTKSVIQAMLEIMGADKEDYKADAADPTAGTWAIGGAAPRRAAPPAPDENRIRQLCDMGFPRASAERALARTHNNVSAATEYLLSHPFSFVGGMVPEPDDGHDDGDDDGDGDDGDGDGGDDGEPEPEAEPEEAEQVPVEASNDQDPSTAEAAPGPAAEPDAEMIDVETTDNSPGKGKAKEATEPDWKKRLDEMREPLKSEVGSRALQLVDHHPSLVFDIKAVFIGPPDGYQSVSVSVLYKDIKSFSSSSSPAGEKEQALAIRCHLLALLLNEATNPPTRISSIDAEDLMGSLLALLRTVSFPEGSPPNIPKWLASHLLVAESIFVLGEEPTAIALPAENELIKEEEELMSGPLYKEARAEVFTFCLRLLAVDQLPRNELMALLRLLVLLTRDHGYATDFVSRGGVTLLLDRFKRPSKDSRGCQMHIAMILRHVVEDRTVLQSIMKQELKKWFSQPRTRSRAADVATLLRNCSQMLLRDPSSFIATAQSICRLVQPHPASGVYHVNLKDDVLSEDKALTPADPSASQAGIPEVVTTPETAAVESTLRKDTPSSEALDSVLRHLISELMRVGKLAVASCAASTPTPKQDGLSPPSRAVPLSSPAAAATGQASPSHASPPEAHEDYLYACFLMQCLTELLSAYTPCKLAFFSYQSKKRVGTPSKDSSKHRSSVLNFLLTDMISVGDAVNASTSTTEVQRRMLLGNWAMSVIVALCVNSSDAPPSGEQKDVLADLASVRKLVLDTIGKAIKEASSVESVETRYAKLYGLAELCYRLLIFKPDANTPAGSRDDQTLQLAKVMVEKNFVGILTNALAEVDLNYPNVKILVTGMLRPIELLTKIAIKMGRATDKGRDPNKAEDDAASSAFSADEEEQEEVEREETPDLYRNSALGMFGGQIEEVAAQDEAEMDADEDEGDDVEMEFGEEEPGSDQTSSSEEEVDFEGDVMEVGTEGSEGAEWEDEMEQEDEGSDDDESGDDEDDDDDGGDGGEQGDEGPEMMMWEDHAEPLIDPAQALAELDLEPGGEGMGVLEAEEDDAEPASEEDFPEHDLNFLEPLEQGDEFGGAWGVANIGLDGHTAVMDLIIPGPGPGAPARTGRLAYMDHLAQVFRRPRQTQRATEDPTAHPLLHETPSPNPPQPHSHSRSARRRNGGGPDDGYNALVTTLEELVGPEGIQLLEQLINRAREGGVIDIGGAAIAGLGRDRLHPPPRHVIAAPWTTRSEEPPRDPMAEAHDFNPVHTLQRWADEVKMTQGKLVAEMISKLQNHFVLALLPAAREEARLAKEKEEKDAAVREEARAEEARLEEARKAEEEERANAAAAAQAAAELQDVVMAEPSSENAHPVPDAPISEAQEAPPAEQQPSSSSESTGVPEVTQAADDATPVASSSGTASAPVTRITVLVNGSPVDITDTGIDPTFLEALPDDMREEVLNQHFRERRAAARPERTHESQISPEFLDALPPEIRDEILQQEGIDQLRRARDQAAQQAGENAPGVPSDIDPASFLASLDPQLRQAVLLEQEEGFINTLPSNLVAEANVLRQGSARRIFSSRVVGVPPNGQGAPVLAARKPPIQRDSIQLLDKTGIATLVRLLFFPHVLRKNSLHKILVNLSVNPKSRSELFNFLLAILQDGTGDLAAVDKSFSQMSFRNKPLATPKATPKSKVASTSVDVGLLSHVPSESVPHLVAQRCLEALTYIVSANEQSSLFFLTENEVPSGLKRSSSKKGKGKEKQTAATHYPIVLLLSLLDREALLKVPSMMSAVVSLLSTVTKPLKDDASSPAEPSQAPPGRESAPALPASTPGPANTATPTPAAPSGTTQSPPVATPPTDAQKLLSHPPQIPHHTLRLIVNILTVGECSSKTFNQAIALIQNLSHLPDARDVIAAELKSKAQELGQSLYMDLDELGNSLARKALTADSHSGIVSRFSSPSSDQAKLLRVLMTIDHMYSAKTTPSPSATAAAAATPAATTDANTSLAAAAEEEKAHAIYETFRFNPLWQRLGDCLASVEENPEIEHIATVLLPLIESLMVVCKYVGTGAHTSTRALRASASPRSPTSPRETAEDLFVTFTDAHRKILNLMVRNNPSLMSGSFSLLVQNPRVLDFDNKRNYFSQQLRRRPHSREHHSTLQLNVRRAHVFEDSYQYLQRKTGEQIKHGKLSIRFYDEEGVDAGGVTREWFQILARQMFNPDYALFQPCAADRLTYQPNRASYVNPEHLSFFKFVGRVIGKAIYDGRLLEAYFARSLYRQLLGKPVDYRDVEWVDPEYYNSLCWILENDPSVLELNFTVEADEFGATKIVSLKENGASIPVTVENRREFVQLSAQYRLVSSIKEQIDSLLAGFYEIIPKDLIAIFNEQEVELLISGTPDIDIDEWRAATDYSGYSPSDPVIVWWWRALKSFNRDERAKVLSFATGTSRVPLGGFVDLQGVQGVQRFSIHRAYGDSDRLPQAHTCFNQIDLPQYSSYEKLRAQLLTAISEGGEGFGFA